MSSPEDKAYEIMRELDVNYVLVIFGGLTGYASDGEGVGLLSVVVGVVIVVGVVCRYQQVPLDGAYRRKHGERQAHH